MDSATTEPNATDSTSATAPSAIEASTCIPVHERDM